MKNYKLIKARNDLGLTQKQMAEKVEISLASYARGENGIRQFEVHEINKILFIIKKSYNEIFLSDMSQI